MRKRVKVDAFADSAFRYLEREVIVCVDVLCSSTMLVTAAAQGRRAMSAAATEDALTMAAGMNGALLAGEIDGAQPPGFEIPNSPAHLDTRTDVMRPLVLAAPGTTLMVNASAGRTSYVACYRNMSATAAHLVGQHGDVVILGAGVGGEFRCEDQMACARIARFLLASGFEAEDGFTGELVDRWGEADLALTTYSKSAAELRRSGRDADVAFVMSHVDDLNSAYRQDGPSLVEVSGPSLRAVVGMGEPTSSRSTVVAISGWTRSTDEALPYPSPA